MGQHTPWGVPKLWKAETCAVLAAGPSMNRETCDRLRGRCRVIAVNNTGIPTAGQPAMAPWADVLFASDAKWWNTYRGEAMKFPGIKIGGAAVPRWDGLHRLAFSGTGPYDPRPTHVVAGHNSGYQAVHIAAHFGATRILLFGFDMKEVGGKRHYFGSHPAPLNSRGRFAIWIKHMRMLSAALAKHGVEVVNCTPGSALTGFKVSTLDQEFPVCAPQAEAAA